MPEIFEKLAYVLRAIWQDQSNHGQRISRTFKFFGWQLWKRAVSLPLVVPVFNGLRFVVYPDCPISGGMIYHRIPDHRDVAFLREHVNGGVWIDIGANVGSLSIVVADKIQHALLFEPNPIAAARARENIAINRLAFEVHEFALSDSTGTVELEDRGGVDSCNRTVVGFRTDLPTRLVRCITLDEFLQSHDAWTYARSAVKIDVEGHENSVLRGMQRFLSEKRPRLIMFEYLERTNLTETLKILENAGYRVFELTSNGPTLVRARVEALQNLFACPRELLREFGVQSAADAANVEHLPDVHV